MRNRVKGFTTVTITLLLVSILVAVSAFIGKVLVSEKRIALNEIEYRVAFAAAEKGVASAMAELKVNPTATVLSGAVAISSAQASYSVTMTPNGAATGVTDVVSVATLDTGGQTTVSVQLAERSILNPNSSGPAAPLLVGGASTGISGNMTVVANPNGGGPGVPVSVWSGKDISGGGSMQTCHLGDYASGSGCSASISTKSGGTVVFDTDVVDNDPDFPADMLEYIFGYGAGDWDKIEAMATAVVTSCSEVNAPGFFIVDGGGECDLSGVTSSASSPAIVIVKDANVKANGGDKFYGLLFSYDSDPTDATVFNLKLNGGAQIFGAISTNHGGDNLNGTFDAVYDAGVFCILTNCDSSGGGVGNPFVSISTIPGSWKDW
ncbi:PilX N-terminal domain-containing pilus assembly protein [Zobellella aerophila]|uniref:Type 4 fimbrial biogenesis protein PilX N-terminal domain-containing protein n=1 Tax=Zobellella aerophila TaxID=870480 RepID=A0ABP6W8V2_9GAMM